MNLDVIEFEQIVEDVTRGIFNDSVLHSLTVIAASSESSRHFVQALIANKSSPEGRPEDAVSATMQVLERLADRSEQVSCTFMKQLWHFADELQMHDICDSIDLWLSH